MTKYTLGPGRKGTKVKLVRTPPKKRKTKEGVPLGPVTQTQLRAAIEEHGLSRVASAIGKSSATVHRLAETPGAKTWRTTREKIRVYLNGASPPRPHLPKLPPLPSLGSVSTENVELGSKVAVTLPNGTRAEMTLGQFMELATKTR